MYFDSSNPHKQGNKNWKSAANQTENPFSWMTAYKHICTDNPKHNAFGSIHPLYRQKHDKQAIGKNDVQTGQSEILPQASTLEKSLKVHTRRQC